jgi:hypothetical protein
MKILENGFFGPNDVILKKSGSFQKETLDIKVAGKYWKHIFSTIN